MHFESTLKASLGPQLALIPMRPSDPTQRSSAIASSIKLREHPRRAAVARGSSRWLEPRSAQAPLIPNQKNHPQKSPPSDVAHFCDTPSSAPLAAALSRLVF